MIEITNLSKYYLAGKVAAIEALNLSVFKGEVLGLIGPNGAGKTTLMQCMLGLIRPSGGQILINGYLPNHLAVKQITSFLPERPLFDGWMTARQFLQYHHMLSRRLDKRRNADVEAALDQVELQESSRNRKIRTFSRGMLQRLGLSQMIIGNPSLCFLDEPTSGLDPISRNIVRETILKWKLQGATVILNSHHLEEVERVCDRVAFMKAGHVDFVERTKAIEGDSVRVIVKWFGPIDTPKRLNEIAHQSDLALEILTPASARFHLRSSQEMPVLVRALVDAQIDVAEVYVERSNLEALFSDIESKDAGL